MFLILAFAIWRRMHRARRKPAFQPGIPGFPSAKTLPAVLFILSFSAAAGLPAPAESSAARMAERIFRQR
ncbi:MAG: hypothetical protein V3U53_00235, partial [bacterium]